MKCRKSVDRAAMIAARKQHKERIQAKAMRDFAQSRGDKYFKGRICKNGHKDGLRYASTGACVKCQMGHDAKSRGAVKKLDRADWVVEPYTPEQQKALEAGHAMRYYGRPCLHGHDGLRYTRTNICVRCSNKRARIESQRRADNPDWQNAQFMHKATKNLRARKEADQDTAALLNDMFD